MAEHSNILWKGSNKKTGNTTK